MVPLIIVSRKQQNHRGKEIAQSVYKHLVATTRAQLDTIASSTDMVVTKEPHVVSCWVIQQHTPPHIFKHQFIQLLQVAPTLTYDNKPKKISLSAIRCL